MEEKDVLLACSLSLALLPNPPQSRLRLESLLSQLGVAPLVPLQQLLVALGLVYAFFVHLLVVYIPLGLLEGLHVDAPSAIALEGVRAAVGGGDARVRHPRPVS